MPWCAGIGGFGEMVCMKPPLNVLWASVATGILAILQLLAWVWMTSMLLFTGIWCSNVGGSIAVTEEVGTEDDISLLLVLESFSADVGAVVDTVGVPGDGF